MGSAVSSVSNAVSGLTGGLSNVVSQVAGIGGAPIGGAIAGIINQLGLSVTPADFTRLQQAGDAAGGSAHNFSEAFTQQGQQANQSLQKTQQSIGQAAGVIGNTQNQALQFAQGMANGTAPSAAQAQLQQGLDQGVQSQMAMANSGNLSQMIGGQREAMMNAANLTQQSANQAAQLRAQQQIAGMQQYGSQATQAGQLAQTQSQQEANIYGQQLGQQAAMAGAQNTAQANQLSAANDQATLQQQANEATAKYKAQAAGGMMNAGGGAVTTLLSDERLKKDVKTDKKMIEAFLDGIEAKSFEYKESKGDKGTTPGTHLGVIAQDVEAAPGGRSMIVETPDGKGIDIPSAVGMLMAASANINDRIKDIELLFKSKKSKG